ncbi:MAG: sigma factor-binding protein Crl [Vibrio sp.]
MSEVTKRPTHYRLLAAFKTIGPYLREEWCRDNYYWFDCLAVCVDDTKAPEKREFWGWWMEFNFSEAGFTASYHVGKYNVDGDWVEEEPPEQAMSDIVRTQEDFKVKLVAKLEERFGQTMSYVE